MPASKLRRALLLAGSSAAAVLLAVSVAPAPAWADNECEPVGEDPADNGDAPDVYECSGATTYQATGVTYDSGGDLTVEAVGSMNVGTVGINLTGNDDDDVTFTATGSISGTAPVLEITSEAGAIDVTVVGITGIRASSTQGGNVSVTNTTGSVNGGLWATSSGANGDVTVVTTGNVSSSGGAQLRAWAEGSGDVNVTTNGSGGAINAMTGTGTMTLNVNAGATSIATDAGGTASINIAPSTGTLSGASVSGLVSMTAAAGTTTTLRNQGQLRSGSLGFSQFDTGSLTPRFTGAGAGRVVIDNEQMINGRADFSALSGGVTFTNEGGLVTGWHTSGDNAFSAGADVLSTAEDGQIFTSVSRAESSPSPTTGIVTTFDFGGGADVLDNAGLLAAGEHLGGDEAPSTLVLENLETFNNAGLVMLGASVQFEDLSGTYVTDNMFNDVLRMGSGVFNGQDGVVWLDVDLSGAGQTSCERDAEGRLAAADCLDLRGATTAGTTYIRVHDWSGFLTPGYNPDGILIVDVGGGTSAAGHFAIDPGSDHYDPTRGVVDKGLFFFPLVYDPDTQRHVLHSLPDSEALQFGLLPQQAQDLWRLSTTGWFDRQADLRGDMDPGVGGGVWLRLTGENAEREVVQSFDAAGATFTFDNSFTQESWAANAGIDLVSAQAGDQGFALGVMVGYGYSDTDYDNYGSTSRLSGFSGGVYASYVAGGFFVDGAVNALGMTVDQDAPNLNLFPSGTVITGDLQSIGGQVETGLRLPLGGAVFVEPVASLAWVKTQVDDIVAPPRDRQLERGILMTFEEGSSLRGALGARLGLDAALGAASVRYSLTGRYWNEFDGDSAFVLDSSGPDLAFAEEFSGGFSEVTGAVAVFGAETGISGVLNARLRFKDDYNAASLSAAVRYRW